MMTFFCLSVKFYHYGELSLSLNASSLASPIATTA
jgi:hypothetical protein